MSDMKPDLKKKIVAASVFSALALLFIGGPIFIIAGYLSTPSVGLCTMEAKICPDGSAVGREGPGCEFTECPASDVDPSWKMFADLESGVVIRYPLSLPQKYIGAVDWPPRVALINGVFSCAEAGSETARAGVTEKRSVEGRDYCVTKESEGAAGSVYTRYAYAAPIGDGTAILTFSLRSSQCANYDEPERSECISERDSFDPDALADGMFKTIKIDDLWTERTEMM